MTRQSLDPAGGSRCIAPPDIKEALELGKWGTEGEKARKRQSRQGKSLQPKLPKTIEGMPNPVTTTSQLTDLRRQ